MKYIPYEDATRFAYQNAQQGLCGIDEQGEFDICVLGEKVPTKTLQILVPRLKQVGIGVYITYLWEDNDSDNDYTPLELLAIPLERFDAYGIAFLRKTKEIPFVVIT